MKIIAASFVVRLDDESDLEAVVTLDELLMNVGLDGPVDTTTEPNSHSDVIRVEFKPSLPP